MTAFLTGFLLGVAGSGHCGGMCGPLALTLGRTLARPSRRAQLGHAVLYHGARAASYVGLAIPTGLAGQALLVGGFGRVLALGSALVLLLLAAGSLRPRIPGRLGRIWACSVAKLCAGAGLWGRSHPIAGPALSGAANGLIPCGLVYAALTAAAGMGRASDAVVLMAGFGLGTLPALLAVSFAAGSLAPALRTRFRRLAPAVLVLTAVLLIVRGLSVHEHVPPARVVPSAVAHH